MSWSIFKYVVDGGDRKLGVVSDASQEGVEDTLPQDPLENVKNYIQKYTENYLIALHYLDVPIIITYSSLRVPETSNMVTLKDYFEPVKDVTRILMQDKAEVVSGLHFIRHGVALRKSILEATDQETFDIRAANSGLETYIINDLRTVWKNSRLKYLKSSLPKQFEVLYLPNTNHPIYAHFVKFLRDIYSRGVDRFKTYICIGSSFIGKSVFFTKFVVPERYYIYHSNNLEYSKMPDQPHKIFRILDDINWGTVSDMEFKALLNRNISSVDVKYSYEYLFPLIPIIIMNKEDYNNFRIHFSNIWEFIERNAVIYPPQNTKETVQEEQPLFTSIRADDNYEYLFEKILPIKDIDEAVCTNTNEWIKDQLDQTQGYYYDSHKYLQLPIEGVTHIPNPSLSKKAILDQYNDFILKKKEQEMKEPIDEKKPRYPLRNLYQNRNSTNNYNNNSYSAKKPEKKKTRKDEDDEEDLTMDEDISGDTIDDDDFDDESLNGDDDYDSDGGDDGSFEDMGGFVDL